MNEHKNREHNACIGTHFHVSVRMLLAWYLHSFENSRNVWFIVYKNEQIPDRN